MDWFLYDKGLRFERVKTLCKQKVKTFFLSTLIALNVKWVPRFITLNTK